jgi:hypothetical protein
MRLAIRSAGVRARARLENRGRGEHQDRAPLPVDAQNPMATLIEFQMMKDEGRTPPELILLPPFSCLSCLGIQWSGRTE